MSNLTKNKIRKVNYRSLGYADNLNDLQVTIIRPNGQNFQPSPNVQNLGDGLYSFSYTPNLSGVWIEKIKSNSNGDDAIQTVVIENYDLDDIQDQISHLRHGGNFQN